MLNANETYPVILTIDDEDAIRISFRDYLEDSCYEVLEADNGKTGLEVFKKELPDLVLLDLSMPKMDGFEVLSIITQHSPDTPIIVISGAGIISDVVRALHLGAWDYLLKPVEDMTMLLHAVEKCLERASFIKKNVEYRENLEKKVIKRTKELESANEQLNEANILLQMSENKFRTLAETSPIAIMMFQERKLIYTNKMVETIVGHSAEEILTLDMKDIIHPDSFTSTIKTISKAREAEAPNIRQEIKIVTKTNEEKWIDLAGGYTEIHDKPSVILSFVDITERKKVEETLQNINKELEKRVTGRTSELKKANLDLKNAKEEADAATQAKSIFLANMSHEIRTPMNGVIAATDLAIREAISPDAIHFLNIIKSSGYSLLGIINDILDFSKIEAGKLDLEMRPFDLDEILDGVAATYINKAIDKNIELLLDIQPETPTALIGDQLRIIQILNNLVSNALKFTDKSGTITIGVKDSKEPVEKGHIKLTFFVEDTGVGMTEEQLHKIFRPFIQADISTTRKFGGTGLGLSICNKLTEIMEGEIWAKSTLEKGSTFYFTVLLEHSVESEKKQPIIPQDLTNLNILAIDDNLDSIKLLERLLVSFSLQVTTTTSGLEGLKILKDKQFDLLIIDSLMPEIRGIELIKQIRDVLNLEIPIVLMSAFNQEAKLSSKVKEQVDCFLNKPFTSASIFNTVMLAFGKAEYMLSPPKDEKQNHALIDRDLVHGMHILVAEDNPINQDIAEAILKKAGITVEIVTNGRDAIEAINNGIFDAVLMDIQMPIMDGHEATRIIRKNQKNDPLPIIAMTAHAMKGDKEKCLESGMDDYVAKPINQDILFQILSKRIKATAVVTATKETESIKSEITANDNQELSDNLSGIEVQNTLKNLGISKKVYKRILIRYYKFHEKVMEEIWAAYETGDLETIKAISHSIKGGSNNIGATDVGKAALALETLANDNMADTKNKIMSTMKINDLDKAVNIVLGSIQPLHEQPESSSESEEKHIVKKKVESIINNLSSAINMADPEGCQENLEILKNLHNVTILQSVEEKIKNYDFDEAMEALKTVAKNLNIKHF